jgi:hypothetical protein
MFAVGQDPPRQRDWVGDTPDGGNCSCHQRPPVHDPGVELDIPVPVQVGAAAGVEDGIILEDAYGGFDRVQRPPPAIRSNTSAATAAGLKRLVHLAGCCRLHAMIPILIQPFPMELWKVNPTLNR